MFGTSDKTPMRRHQAARQTVARGVNTALMMLYWKVGERIRKDILKDKRAEYGEEILPTLSAKVAPEFGEGFRPRNLARMIALTEVFSDRRIVSALRTLLGWSHFVELLPLKKHLQKNFYAEMGQLKGWRVRTLRWAAVAGITPAAGEPKALF